MRSDRGLRPTGGGSDDCSDLGIAHKNTYRMTDPLLLLTLGLLLPIPGTRSHHQKLILRFISPVLFRLMLETRSHQQKLDDNDSFLQPLVRGDMQPVKLSSYKTAS